MIAGYPLLVLTHQLGHAIVAAAYGRPAKAVVGGEARAIRFGIGRLHVSFSPLARGGSCLIDAHGLTIHRRRMVLIAGPLASAVAGIVLMLVALLATEVEAPLFWALVVLGVLGLLDAVSTAWPRRGAERRGWDGPELRRLRSFEPHYVPQGNGGERSICRTG